MEYPWFVNVQLKSHGILVLRRGGFLGSGLGRRVIETHVTSHISIVYISYLVIDSTRQEMFITCPAEFNLIPGQVRKCFMIVAMKLCLLREFHPVASGPMRVQRHKRIIENLCE